jgi:hypothetical protein
MYKQENENPHKGKLISVSQLCGGCKRKTMLERNFPYFIVPDQKLPTFRGTLVHSLVELSKTPEILDAGWIIEKHMELPVTTESGDWVLSGTLDAFDKKRKTLFDIKTLQEYAIVKMVRGNEKGTWSNHISDQYVKQANLYGYMGRKLKLFAPKKLRLQIFGFSRLILTGTTVVLKDRWKEEEFFLPDIPILPDEEIESWIKIEGDSWFRIMFEERPAPVCTKEFSWLCKKCHFNGTRYCPDPMKEREEEI